MPSSSWHDDAKCRDYPDNMDDFFPERDHEGYGQKAIHRARSICLGLGEDQEPCPVLETCREYGLKYEQFGIWGGLTEGERRHVRRGTKWAMRSSPMDYTRHAQRVADDRGGTADGFSSTRGPTSDGVTPQRSSRGGRSKGDPSAPKAKATAATRTKTRRAAAVTQPATPVVQGVDPLTVTQDRVEVRDQSESLHLGREVRVGPASSSDEPERNVPGTVPAESDVLASESIQVWIRRNIGLRPGSQRHGFSGDVDALGSSESLAKLLLAIAVAEAEEAAS